jgi:hypothetical protein
MSTVLRRKRASHRELGPYRRYELLTGEIKYPAIGYTGYGDGQGDDLAAFISDDMRADWFEHRAELLEFWAAHGAIRFDDENPWLDPCGHFEELPWAAEQFGPDLEATERELLELGRRHREAYAEELRKAQRWAAYRRELIAHPERGGSGTRCDPASRREDLAKANSDVRYWRGVMARLDAPPA